jgi:hydroxymethylglutaryl-CoA reductase (NADPH)
MSSSSDKAKKALHILSALQNIDSLIQKILNKSAGDNNSESLHSEENVTEEGINKRIEFLLNKTKKELPFLSGKKHFTDLNQLEGNIENYIGMSMVPTGIIGPLRVIGSAAQGDFYIPLSTSEGTLVASYHRGAKACLLAGGATSI